MGSGASRIRRRKLATHISDKTYVEEITVVELGRFLVKTCGNEGRHPSLDEKGKTTLKYLRASIDFIPEAIAKFRADMRNGSFIYAQPDSSIHSSSLAPRISLRIFLSPDMDVYDDKNNTELCMILKLID
ncbi:uncharacterized protein LOC122965102 [Acropora millepora]|uniref:uncharacterized protein LOC122965102 n=1 Tax=Acropora millepora TaxID=45264 RepID=UPI001CF1336A|nr:uncharacterized protein LOC122965102 [Acropora millepora]